MNLLEEALAELKMVWGKLRNREEVLAAEIEPAIQKIEQHAAATAEADLPQLEQDAERVLEEGAQDAETVGGGVVADVRTDVQAPAAAAPQAASEPTTEATGA